MASFGTSYPQTRKATIKACEQKIAEEFPAYEIRRAFTSQMVINKLEKKENLIIDNPRQGLQKLKQENFSEVIIQPLHIIPGLEYHGLVRTAKQFKNDFKTLKIGEPLFYSNHDYQLIAEAIKSQSPEPEIDTAVVLMGHGSQHPSNAVYACFDYVLTEECDHNIYVGTVEGYPGLDSVIGRLKKDDIKKVHLMPLMLVAGDHAQNDMAGSKDSWKSILAKKGFEVEVHLKGLGENRAIQQLYIKKVKKLVSGKQKLCAGS
ncbi:MAG: sirohydrochlorin cobaltochelatase [Bacillota bacterium]